MSNAAAVVIHHKGERIEGGDDWQVTLDAAVARLGPWSPPESHIELWEPNGQGQAVSTFESQIVDDGATVRIEGLHAALGAAGVQVNTAEQLYLTGTRMADVGYQTQAVRAREHADKRPVAEVAAELAEIIKAEQRHQITMSGADMARKLALNGKLTVAGYKLNEHAIRGMLGRAESGASGYVFALRDRIKNKRPDLAADKVQLLATLTRELEAASGEQFTLRVRDGLGDCFAVVSPSYAVADAPLVIPDVLAALPADAKASFSYDPHTTTWELRASVFTPTPTDEQAVGEPFEGYVSFRSNDAGGGSLRGGGGILILRCLNASTYEAATERASRQHRGRILLQLGQLTQQAGKAIHALCQAWGVARETEVPVPAHYEGALIPTELVIPGLFRGLLTDRQSPLIAVHMPGRREEHVMALAKTFTTERRNGQMVVRADMANAMTRYGQGMPSTVRRDVEQLSAAWVVGRHVPRWEPLRVAR